MPIKIIKNRGYSFVFAQKNAETALVSKTKGFKAGNRLFSWREYWLSAYPRPLPKGKGLEIRRKNDPPFHTNGGFVVPYI